MAKVSFLSFIISAHKVSADLAKIEAIMLWFKPNDVHDVCSFMGLGTFCRRFVQGFSPITAPITDLMGLHNFVWMKAANKAFEEIKHRMSKASTLRLPDFNKPVIGPWTVMQIAAPFAGELAEDEG
ncbi:putative mitochondrial protein AtMg00860 [Wolffia australiana]